MQSRNKYASQSLHFNEHSIGIVCLVEYTRVVDYDLLLNFW